MEPLYLTMLGVGNGFSKGVYNNNALLKTQIENTLIDCGITAWQSLEELGKVIDDIDKIFITHLHFDHSGGLEPAALYTAFMSEKRIKLIVPKPIKNVLWENVLKGTIENKSKYLTQLEDFFDVFAPAENELFNLCGDIKARWIRTKHVEGKFSCGLIIEEKMFYSSDIICDHQLMTNLYQQGIEIFFHDCQLNGGEVHAAFNEICKYPEPIRKHMFLMHHGQSSIKADYLRYGMKFLKQHELMELYF